MILPAVQHRETFDMKCLVTGAAGFIGSHLCERLLDEGHEVVGLDSFVPYYPRVVKENNLTRSSCFRSFTFLEQDLRTASLEHVVQDTEVVFHLAAMAGLTRSWTDFDLYASCNLQATQRLLEVASRCAALQRFICVSTSSVYGRHASGDETLPTRPISPYGTTKLAAENLCRAYAAEKGVPAVILRYFSVYGPRQRPDMGYHRFVEALLKGESITVYGDGNQVRGNTYVADCVEATVRAVKAIPGEVYNVGGGETASVREIVARLERIIGRRAVLRYEAPRQGDQMVTAADTSKIVAHLGWKSRTNLDEGLSLQVAWQTGVQSRRAA